MTKLNLDPLFDAVDLLRLIGSSTRLVKRGKSFEGKCPLHDEKTPSFSVYPGMDGRWRWHCFGACDTGGDAIAYVQRRDSAEFLDAVKTLADWAGVGLEKLNWSAEAVAEHKRQTTISELLTRATRFYQQQMLVERGEHAMAYATGRGFSAEHVCAIGWGFSAADDGLLKWLASTDESVNAIPLAREIGLIRADGRDFCANAEGDTVSPAGWLIYPHWRGNAVTYLSARALSKVASGSKSRNLPGQRQVYAADRDLTIDQANKIKLKVRHEALLLVEGPADAETCRHWRLAAWAMCGAPVDEADNPDLIRSLQKMAEHTNVYAAMSNDAAGQRFAEKTGQIVGPLLRILTWPKANETDLKSDANECLQRGMTDVDVDGLLAAAPTYLDTKIEETKRQTDVRTKAEHVERLADLTARLSETERRIYVGRIVEAGVLDMSRREFEQMVLERLPRNDGSAIDIRAGKLAYLGEPLINGVARVERELIVDDGLNPPHIEYRVTGKMPNGKLMAETDVPVEEFDGMKWISKAWGARMYPLVGSGKFHLLKRAILETSMEAMIVERIHTFTGWYTVNGKRAFLSATGALTADGLDDSVHVDLEHNLAHYALPKPATGQDLVQAFLTSLEFMKIAPSIVTTPIWAAMYQAVLTSIKPLNAVIQIYGPTQSKKSTIAHVALSHYGAGFISGRQYHAPRDWTSTAADLEGTMFTVKDLPLCIDDYAPQFSSAQESRDIVKRAHYVVRSVGNRSARGRRNADMTARTLLIPRGLVIMTAEQPLTGQSIVGRTVVIPIEYGAVDVDRLSAAQDVHEQYSVAMAGYVQWLIRNWERVNEESPKMIAQWIADVRGAFPNQDRLGDYYAVLRLGLHWAYRFGAEIGAVEQADAEEAAGAHDLLMLLESQSTRVAEQSPVRKFFIAIDDLLTSGRIAIIPRTQHDATNAEIPAEAPHGALLIGWKVPDKRQVWLLTSQALTVVKEHWNGLDERFDTLADALRREIWQYGYVPERDETQIEISKWINTAARSKRVLVIDADKVYANFGVDLIGDAVADENNS